jgi:hypothetical protein
MARFVLTFETPAMAPGGVTPTATIDDGETFKTADGPKLGSALAVGDAVSFGSNSALLVIATKTPE